MCKILACLLLCVAPHFLNAQTLGFSITGGKSRVQIPIEVQNNLIERDRIDSSRADSPLRQADDAVVIDNTLLSEEQQLEKALALARERIDALLH